MNNYRTYVGNDKTEKESTSTRIVLKLIEEKLFSSKMETEMT